MIFVMSHAHLIAICLVYAMAKWVLPYFALLQKVTTNNCTVKVLPIETLPLYGILK